MCAVACLSLLTCCLWSLASLQRCIARVQEPGQSWNDIVRRSAGLPFAIAGLFLAEPAGVPRVLLPLGMSQLLAVAQAEGSQPWPRVSLGFWGFAVVTFLGDFKT